MLSDQPDSHLWDEKHLRFANAAGGVALWSWNIDTDRITLDDRAFEMWGVTRSGPVTFEDLAKHIHPLDLDTVRAAFEATRTVAGPYEIDFRIYVLDEIRWVSARGEGDDVGLVNRIVYGVFLNITQRKQVEEANELMAEEMSHRVKNLLAIACGLTELSWRSATSPKDMARDLSNRLISLGRAHDLVRPAPGEDHKLANLGELLAILLAPFDDTSNMSGRIRISANDVYVGERSATAMALVVHELGTNALKYGALSVEGGTLDLRCGKKDDDVFLSWSERGGPVPIAPSASPGFGSKMVTRTMRGQLGGSIVFDWRKEGVIITLTINKDRLAE